MNSCTTVVISLSRLDANEESTPEKMMVIDFCLDEICRTFSCSQENVVKLKNLTKLPTIRSTNLISLDELILSDDPFYFHALPSGSSFFEYIESIITSAAREEAMKAMGVDALGLKAKVRIFTNCYEPAEFCSTCSVDFGSKETPIRRPCGHSYHDECMPYYRELQIECPECYYGNVEPLVQLKPLDLVKIKFTGGLFSRKVVVAEEEDAD